MTEHAPAGFYPDPEGGPDRRFWNGRRWTDKYDPPRHYWVRWLLGVCALGMVLYAMAALTH